MDRGHIQPLVSVIIPHYGGMEILRDCLNSLTNSDYPMLEIIVLDNNSLDDSVKNIQNNFPNVKFIKSKYNREIPEICLRYISIVTSN